MKSAIYSRHVIYIVLIARVGRRASSARLVRAQLVLVDLVLVFNKTSKRH